jgi:hypothetical protein
MFAIEDERHAEVQGTYATEAEAMAELKHRSRVPWSEEPNRAPCMNWANCGRSYELVEYDENNLPHWRELSRVKVLDVSAAGVSWYLPAE